MTRFGRAIGCVNYFQRLSAFAAGHPRRRPMDQGIYKVFDFQIERVSVGIGKPHSRPASQFAWKSILLRTKRKLVFRKVQTDRSLFTENHEALFPPAGKPLLPARNSSCIRSSDFSKTTIAKSKRHNRIIFALHFMTY